MRIPQVLFRCIAVSILLLGSSLFGSTAHAATCSITSATVVNQTYVTSNNCTAIEINGNVSTTWIGTVDLGGGTVTVKSGYTMTMGSSSAMVLGANDDFVVETNATTTHLRNDIEGVQITARNITVTGKINSDGKGCNGGGAATMDGSGPHATTRVCTLGATGAGQDGGGGGGGGSAGSHGGLGSRALGDGAAVTTTVLYGDSLAPVFLGSGGGQGYYSNAFGGHGGGRVALVASGVLTVTGSVSANGDNGSAGQSGYNGGGAGSGGSISITAGTLAGSGTVSANGGVGGTGAGTNSNGGGHGGGGRVAVKYDTSTFTLSSITATGGSRSGWTSGQNGSTYILNRVTDDGGGTLTITSGFDFPFSGDYVRDTISVSSGAFLQCPYAATSTSLTVSATSWITLPSVQWECYAGISEFTLSSSQGLSTTSTTMIFGSTTSVRIDVPTWTNVTTSISTVYGPSSMTVDVDNSLEWRGFVYTGPNSASSASTMLTLNAPQSVSLVSSNIYSNVSSTILGALTLDANSSINADGRGCLRGRSGGDGYGPDSTTGVCTITTTGYGKGAGGGGAGGGGAAHAGAGGTSEGGGYTQSTTYGSSTNPTLFGSGGGSGYDFAGGNDMRGEGGNGGGIIRIRVSGALTVGGTISANGNAGNNEAFLGFGGGGGGSGGSLYLYVGSISGNGTISARGGAGGLGGNGGTSYDAGGGGGGRIAIYYSSQSGTAYSGASVTGGTVASGATAGSAGSLYTFQTNITPDAPSSLGPTGLVNGSTTGTTNPIFTFTLADSDVSDTVKFQIQIDNSSDFGSVVIDYTSALAAQGAASFQVGQAAGSGAYSTGAEGQTLSSTSYYWRVKTIDQNAAESSYSTANSGSVAFIVDSATRSVSFLLSAGSGLESVTATSIRIVLDTTHFENVTVNYAVSSTLTTATGSGTDYTLSSGTATITAGETSTTVALAVANDDIDEANEIVAIDLSSPTYASLGATNSIQYTITDNDTAGVTLSETTATVTEGGATDTYTLVLTSQPTSTVRVTFATSTYGITLNATTVDFTSDNWSTPQTITITGTNDLVAEGTHTASATHAITVPSGFAYGYSSGVSVENMSATITDNDTAGITASTNAVSVTEGASAQTMTYVLDTAPTSTVTLTFSTSTNGITIVPVSLAFTSENWSTPQSISITGTDDNSYEASHSTTVQMTVSGSVYGYASVTPPTVTVTITDNDTSSITLSASTFTIQEGASDTLTIVLTSQPTSTVLLGFTVPNQLRVSPSTITFTDSDWNITQTLTITPVDDNRYAGTRADTISIGITSETAFASAVLPALTITITDNEFAPVGGGGAGAGAGIALPIPFIPLPSTSGATTQSPSFSVPSPTAEVNARVEADLRAFKVKAAEAERARFTTFIRFGSGPASQALGEGERRAVLRDALETMRRSDIPQEDLERISKGEIPKMRNLIEERKQVARALPTFQSLFGQAPDFSNPAHNLAWNTLLYRIRFPRDLKAEQQGIKEFKQLFNRSPQDPFQWATVRVLGYIQK